MTKLVADRTRLIDASGIRKVFALAAELKDPINFSIGQPDFEVPEPLKAAAIKAIEAMAAKRILDHHRLRLPLAHRGHPAIDQHRRF